MRSLYKILGLCVLLPSLNVQSQNFTSSFTVKMDGYIIQLDGAIIFQPAPDSTLGFWKSLDNSSFGIRCNPFEHFQCESLYELGKQVSVSYRSGSDSAWYKSTLRYFRASIEIVMPFLSSDTNDFKLYRTPRYLLMNDTNTYPMEGFYIRERIVKLIPVEKEHFLKMRAWYEQKGWHIPNWLETRLRSK